MSSKEVLPVVEIGAYLDFGFWILDFGFWILDLSKLKF